MAVGARVRPALRRAAAGRLVQTAVGDQLAKALLAGEVSDGDTVLVDLAPTGDSLTVTAAPAVPA